MSMNTAYENATKTFDAEYAQTATKITELAGKIQKEVGYLSVGPVTKTGDELFVNVVNGIFVAPSIDWAEVCQKLGPEYLPYDAGVSGEIVNSLDMRKICPPRMLKREFKEKPPSSSVPGQNIQEKAYCYATINLDVSSDSREETKVYLRNFFAEKQIPEGKYNSLLAWLNDPAKTGESSFFDVVSFEISSSFNVEEYLTQRLEMPQPPNQKARMPLKELKKNAAKLQQTRNKLDEKLEAEATEAAVDLSELVAEKMVYPDFLRAFKNMPASPFIQYEESKLNLQLDLKIVDPQKIPIPLGRSLLASVKVTNPVAGKKELGLDANFKICINSKYFEEPGKEKDQTGAEGEKTSNPEQQPKPASNAQHKEKTVTDEPGKTGEEEGKPSTPELNPEPASVLKQKEETITLEPGFSVERTLKLVPKIKEILELERSEYPVVIEIVDAKNDSVLVKDKLNVPLKEPDMKLVVQRPRLPHKGENIEMNFHFEFNANDESLEGETIEITGVIGPDFKCLESGKESANFEDSFEITNKATMDKPYLFLATRAGFPGYPNKAFFRVFLGKWKTHIGSGNVCMTVLPNWLDTAIAGLTVTAGIVSALYPNVIPSITSEVNVANLSSSAAVVYLGFRALSWGINTQKT